MSKKNINNRDLEKKIISLFKKTNNKYFNSKQVSSELGIIDTQSRNDIIKILNKLHLSKIISKEAKGK